MLYFLWTQLLMRWKCPRKHILASIHDCDATGWNGTSHAHLKWRSILHQVHLLLQHVHFTAVCQPWDPAPPSFFILSPIHVSCLTLREMDGQTLQPEMGPAHAVPPCLLSTSVLQRGEAGSHWQCYHLLKHIGLSRQYEKQQEGF